MYTKQDFVNSFSNNTRILKHLAAKIPAGKADFRPSLAQRSVLELMQYLSSSARATCDAILRGSIEAYKNHDGGKETTFENFAEMMDKQEAEVKIFMEKFTDEELAKVINLYGMGEKTKGVYLVDTIGTWFPAYKMQLFLYMKQMGIENIGTSNLWGGMDMPVK
jgi:hypothetical protein